MSEVRRFPAFEPMQPITLKIPGWALNRFRATGRNYQGRIRALIEEAAQALPEPDAVAENGIPGVTRPATEFETILSKIGAELRRHQTGSTDEGSGPSAFSPPQPTWPLALTPAQAVAYSGLSAEVITSELSFRALGPDGVSVVRRSDVDALVDRLFSI